MGREVIFFCDGLAAGIALGALPMLFWVRRLQWRVLDLRSTLAGRPER